MAKIVFKCLRCGRCCKNLYKEMEGVISGLDLLPNEKNLFTDNLISPHYGIGWGMSSGPKYIISYQSNVNVCPYLSKDNLCKAHDKRPITCRAFPLISIGPVGTSIAQPEDCTFVEEVEKKVGSLDKMRPITPKKFRAPNEWQAIATLNALCASSFTNHPTDARVLWVFDLKSKEWQIDSAR